MAQQSGFTKREVKAYVLGGVALWAAGVLYMAWSDAKSYGASWTSILPVALVTLTALPVLIFVATMTWAVLITVAQWLTRAHEWLQHER